MIDKCVQLVLQSIDGYEIENPKVDFKADWYDLKSNKGISEFVKDTTAIANTYGLDGYIIIGYDEKQKKITGTNFKKSGLRDSSELPYIIIKNCSHLFDFNYSEIQIENKILGIIHIPPALEKPFFIKRHRTFHKNGTIKKEEEQRVFVRKGTSTFPANRSDFELMYYDRKNILPDYSYNLDVTFIKFERRTGVFGPDNKEWLCYNCDLKFVLENIGRRAISIKNYKLIGHKGSEEICFHFIGEFSNHDFISLRNLVSHDCRHNEVLSKKILLATNDIGKEIDNEYFESYTFIASLTNGKEFIHNLKYDSN